ncbi:MAG: conjugal transfer protein, partial [Paracoccus sp. (in: a-proteobacteria)]|nr:conjugal transfer protein [Paracoccus sp. (in: a-proteobacteria)]
MSQDTEDLAARLAALEATGDKKRGAARPSPLAAILGVAGIVAVGGLAWAALQPSPEAPLPTAAPEEFQTTGSGFGDLAPMPVVESAPPP